MIRVVLPAHLRTLARVEGEVMVDVRGDVTARHVIDAILTAVVARRSILTRRPHVCHGRRRGCYRLGGESM